jgi:hypothetical protein
MPELSSNSRIANLTFTFTVLLSHNKAGRYRTHHVHVIALERNGRALCPYWTGRILPTPGGTSHFPHRPPRHDMEMTHVMLTSGPTPFSLVSNPNLIFVTQSFHSFPRRNAFFFRIFVVFIYSLAVCISSARFICFGRRTAAGDTFR